MAGCSSKPVDEPEPPPPMPIAEPAPRGADEALDPAWRFRDRVVAARLSGGEPLADPPPVDAGYEAFLEEMTPKDLLGGDFIAFTGPTPLRAQTGDKVELSFAVGRAAGATGAATLQINLRAWNDLGGLVELHSKPREAAWKPGEVVDQKPVVMSLPDMREAAGALTAELLDENGERLAADLIRLLVERPEPPGEVEAIGPRRLALRFQPDRPTDSTWRRPSLDDVFFGADPGRVTYEVAVPREAIEAGPTRVELYAEAAGRARVAINGRPFGEFAIPGERADARGWLSIEAGWRRAAYGDATRHALDLDAEAVAALRSSSLLRVEFEVPSPPGSGLILFGSRVGRYPMAPTLLLTTTRTLPMFESLDEPRR